MYNTNTQPCRLICAPTKNLPLAVSSSPTILYNILSIYVGVSLCYMYMHCLGCAVLLCLVCLFDLACFFLSFFLLISHLSFKNMHIVHTMYVGMKYWSMGWRLHCLATHIQATHGVGGDYTAWPLTVWVAITLPGHSRCGWRLHCLATHGVGGDYTAWPLTVWVATTLPGHSRCGWRLLCLATHGVGGDYTAWPLTRLHCLATHGVGGDYTAWPLTVWVATTLPGHSRCGWRLLCLATHGVGGDYTAWPLTVWVATTLPDHSHCGWRLHCLATHGVGGDYTAWPLTVWVATTLPGHSHCGERGQSPVRGRMRKTLWHTVSSCSLHSLAAAHEPGARDSDSEW